MQKLYSTLTASSCVGLENCIGIVGGCISWHFDLMWKDDVW
jgi:hypothetical protein